MVTAARSEGFGSLGLSQSSPPVMTCIWAQPGELLLHEVLSILYAEPFALRSHARASADSGTAGYTEDLRGDSPVLGLKR